jgi:ribosomal protein L14
MKVQNNTVSAEFLERKETKGTYSFYEVDDGTGEQLTGIIYIKKGALRKLGYKTGDIVVVTVSVKKEG